MLNWWFNTANILE